MLKVYYFCNINFDNLDQRNVLIIINTACLQNFYNYLAMKSGFDEVNLTIAEILQDVLFVEVRDCCGTCISSLVHPQAHSQLL